MVKVGIQNNGIFIGAVYVPNRKKPCLVVERGDQYTVIGSFINTASTEYFEKSLRELLNVPEQEGGGDV